MERLLGIGGIAFLGAFMLVVASFRLRSPLGRYKPVQLMLALFACYNILPFVAIAMASDIAEPILGPSADYYSAVNLERIGLLVLACTIAGVTGLIVGSLPLKAASPIEGAMPIVRRRVPSHWHLASFAVIFLASCLLLWQLRGFLFAGYHEEFGSDEGEVLLRGSLSSLFSLLFVAYMFLRFSTDDGRGRPLQRRRTFWITTAALLFAGAALLSFGGRLYVVSAVIAYLSLQASRAMPARAARKSKPVNVRYIAWGVVVVAAAAGVGVWRIQGEFSALAVVANLLGEPLFVSISLASLLQANRLPVIAFPSFLLEDAVGLLPSALYPAKLERLFAVANTYVVDAPGGGLNGLASLVANFGWGGAVVVFGLACWVIAILARMASGPRVSPPLRMVFVLATAMPLLSLMRDPFVISIYKNFLQNALFWTLLLASLGGYRLILRRGMARHGRTDGMHAPIAMPIGST